MAPAFVKARHKGLQRMVGNVQAEQIALKAEQLRGRIIGNVGNGNGFYGRPGVRIVAEHIRQRHLPVLLVLLRPLRRLAARVEGFGQGAAVGMPGQGRERAALYQRFHRAPRHAARFTSHHAQAEIAQTGKRPALLPHPQNHFHRRPPDAFDGGETEADRRGDRETGEIGRDFAPALFLPVSLSPYLLVFFLR